MNIIKLFIYLLFLFCPCFLWGQAVARLEYEQPQGSFNNPTPHHFKAEQGETEIFLYFYHTSPLYTPDINARLEPKCDLTSTCTPPNNFINVLANPPTFTYTGCLDLNDDGFPGGIAPSIEDCTTKECYYAVKAYWENLKGEIDGGDKQALLDDLYNSPAALETYQKYMTASPYLSDEVLVAVATKELMSPSRRANILLANAPLSDEVMYQIQDIVAGNVYQLLYTIKHYTKLSARDNLNMSISKETAKKEELLRELLTKYSDEKDYANLDELLSSENTGYALHILLASKMNRGDYDAAQAILDGLPAETPDEQDYKTVQQINLERHTTTGTAFELTPNQYAQLRAIADAKGSQAPTACSLLSLLRDEYCEWTLPDVESGKSDTHPRYKDVALLDKSVLNRLSIAPNPAGSSFEVQLPAYFSEQGGAVQVLDLSGKTLQTLPLTAEQQSVVVRTTDLPNGVYIVQYAADGIVVSTAKVVVQH